MTLVTTFDRLPMERVRFGVVLNDVPAESSLPIAMTGWELDFATQAELDELVPELRAFAAPFRGVPTQEQKLARQGDGVRLDPAPQEDWRYCVVRPTVGDAMPGYKLSEALRISDADIWVETWGARPRDEHDQYRPGLGGNPGAIGQFFASAFSRPLIAEPIPVSSLVETVRLRAELDDDKHQGVARTLALFRDLDVVAESSPAKVLGYFSVLESLLSHAPQPGDPVDSITRQLKRNLILIDNRLAEDARLPLSGFKKTTGTAQVVGKLYSVRSAYAHGSGGTDAVEWLADRLPPDLASTPLWLPKLMRILTRRVLQAALREPQLITDLRGS